MSGQAADATFVRELRMALRYLYDPVALRRSPLVALFGLGPDADPPASLRRLLVEVIDSFKPTPDVPPQATAWRIYQILYERFVEQFSQQEVAMHLAVGTRQLRRQEGRAVRLLADWLWAHHILQARAADAPTEPAAAVHLPGSLEMPTREQELEWLRASDAREWVALDELVRTVLKIVDPLRRALDVSVQCDVPDSLPRMTVQLTSLRQALSNVLTAAIRTIPHGHLLMRAELQGAEICLRIQAQGLAGTRVPLSGDDHDNLDMARRMVGFSGGSLEVRINQEGWEPFAAHLILPASAQINVLAIDDNADTLQLLERYLSGTRYRFAGTSDPQQAVALAEEAAPAIIVLDVMLPGVDGWELLGRLREHPQTRGVPIVVCTILAQEQLATALGAAAFMRKPIRRQTLLAVLDQQADLLVKASGSGPRCR